MLYLIIISFVFNFFLYILLKELIQKRLEKNELMLYNQTRDRLESLKKDHSRISNTIEELKKTLELNIQLYEISRQLYNFLDEDKLFFCFKDILSNFLSFKDCFLIKNKSADIKLNDDDSVLELRINSEFYGFLIIRGLSSNEDREKFYILAQQFILALKRAIFYRKVEELSITDSLTGLFNRRYFLEKLEEEVRRSEKFKFDFSFVMIDIDDFKLCNDLFGHLVGDYVLKEVAKIIKDNIRHIDFACRYGGEEFCILFPQTEIKGAFFAAERIRRQLETRKIHAYDEEITITVSIGVACFPEDAREVSELIEKADSALYTAKKKGKNRVCLYRDKEIL